MIATVLQLREFALLFRVKHAKHEQLKQNDTKYEFTQCAITQAIIRHGRKSQTSLRDPRHSHALLANVTNRDVW